MVRRSRRGKANGGDGANRPGAWVWGRRAVFETLRAGRWPIRDLWLADRIDEPEVIEVQKLVRAWDVEVVIEPAESLAERCQNRDHQGFLARVGEFPYEEPEQLLTGSGVDGEGSALFLLLDSVQDPFNLGAIIRSAEVFGVSGVFVSGDHQAPVTGHVARSSAGAINHVRVARAENLVTLVMQLRRAKVQVLGAAADGARPAREYDLAGPVAIVLGNEGYGVGGDVMDICDDRIGIEQRGNVESLNAAVAAGVLLYETDRQRRMGEATGDD